VSNIYKGFARSKSRKVETNQTVILEEIINFLLIHVKRHKGFKVR